MRKWLLVAFVLFPASAGAVRGTLHDITDRKTLEEALRRQNEESARLNYTVSHDLRSPLVTIKAFLGYLEQDIRDACAGPWPCTHADARCGGAGT